MIEIQVNRSIPPAAYNALGEAIRAVLPVVFIGLRSQKGVLFLIFTPQATEDNQNTALQIAMNFDTATRTAEEIAKATRQTDFLELLDAKATAAITQIDNDLTTLGGSPTNAQVIAILSRCLTRQKAIIKGLQKMKDLIVQ